MRLSGQFVIDFIFFHEENYKHLKHKQKASQVTLIKTINLKEYTKASQVTFIKTINLKNTNKSISSNFHLGNILKKLLSRKYT